MNYKSVEYTAFALENFKDFLKDANEACKYLTPVFKVEKIYINKEFCTAIVELNIIHNKIFELYNKDQKTMSQFMQAFKESLYNNFAGYPNIDIFMKFYQLYVKIVKMLDPKPPKGRQTEILKIEKVPQVILNIVILYDSPELKNIREFLLPKQVGVITHIVSLSKNRIVTCSAVNELNVWSVGTGELLFTLLNKEGDYINHLIVLNDDRIATASNNNINIWNCNNGTLQGKLKVNPTITCLIAMGTKIISGSEDGSIKMHNYELGSSSLDLPSHTSEVTSLAISDGKIISGSTDGIIRIWEGGEEEVILKTNGSKISSLHVISKKLLAVLDVKDNLYVWDLEEKKITFTLPNVSKILIMPNKNIVITSPGSINIYSKEGKLLHKKDFLNHVLSIAAYNNNTIVMGLHQNTLSIWNPDIEESFNIVGERNFSSSLFVITVLPTGQIVTGSDDGYIGIWG